MSDSMDPPWHFLPHAPRQFFGISSDGDQKQLKQAYSTLIRRFKPEKYPQEFKKIRAAFEQLEHEMRYGMGESSLLMESTTTSTPIAGDGAPSKSIVPSESELRSALTERAAAYQRIASQEPTAWYAEVRAKEHKTAYDYYLLAVLSDVVGDECQGFFAWIAEGYMRHPEDTNTASLYRSVLASSELETKEMADLLSRMSRTLRGRDYFFMTEALWKHFSVRAPWPEFESQLRELELKFSSSDDRSRVAFTIALMRKVMWRAPLEWLHEKKRWIESSRQELQNQLEFDHDLNCRLLLLREHHTQRLENGKYGRSILHAIQSFCEEGEWDACTKICECQIEIAANPKEFLREFEFSDCEDVSWSNSWTWISWTALSLLPTQEQTGNQEWLVQSVLETMQTINGRFPHWIGRNAGWMNFFATVGFVALAFVASVIFVIVFTVISIAIFGLRDQWSPLLILPTLVLIGIGMFHLFKKLSNRWNARVIQPYIRRNMIVVYRSRWRLILARLMQRLVCPFHYLIGIANHLSDQRNVPWVSQWVAQLIAKDLGLILYCTAVPFAR